jgi:hypothetical protein
VIKYTGTLRVPGLGLELPVEVDLAPVLPPPRDEETVAEAQLAERWQCSRRTLKRLRDQRRLPYQQPSPRKFLYRLEDVRAYEAANHRGVARRKSA